MQIALLSEARLGLVSMYNEIMQCGQSTMRGGPAQRIGKVPSAGWKKSRLAELAIFAHTA